MGGTLQFVNSKKVAEIVLSLPMHPYLEENEVENVSKIVKNVLESGLVDTAGTW